MITHYGHFDGHRLRASSFAAEVKGWPAGTPLEFTCRKARKRKSTAQNAYLHVLFTIAARSLTELTGENYTMEQVKAYAKVSGMYPTLDFVRPGTGEVVQVPMDTRDLDKEEAMITIDRVIAHFADIGIVLPAPGEQIQMT